MEKPYPAKVAASSDEAEPLRFDHVGLSVAELERSHRFYADVLGFGTVEDSFRLPEHEIRGLVLLNRIGVRIELFERQGSRPGRVGHPSAGALTQGWLQFALAVDDVDEEPSVFSQSGTSAAGEEPCRRRW